MLKIGNDNFEVTHLELKVDVSQKPSERSRVDPVAGSANQIDPFRGTERSRRTALAGEAAVPSACGAELTSSSRATRPWIG
jgi:hypothetical protein